ncbi:hypothetical protein [Arthrobacter sp. EpRS71]|uniref:hypothetical protein n=1 Tax=Arthrobacter sp. EpRS71 TaxID=1743141 RepID=UPI000A70C1AC|nr:hypothetical protein [Arthrobacter sp. EpRS71]
MDIIVAPDDLVKMVFEQFFGRASLVVFMWVLATTAVAWISLGRQAVQAKDIVKRLFSFTSDRYGLQTGKVKAVLQIAGYWALFYGVASFVTQLFAGSEFSKGRGGGLAELLTWSVLFGLLTVFGTLLLLPTDYDGVVVFYCLFIGYGVGSLYAVITFTSKGGPNPGDWWVAPAASCCLMLVSASYARVKPRKKDIPLI